MTHLDGIIKFYLQNETNNSLLITGDWGVGKTYYYKNILEKEIETFPTYFDNKKKYKSIVVSLFGISSIDEIQSQILLSLYPILGNKKVKISAAIAKIFIKGILKFKNIDQYYDIVSEIGIDKKTLLILMV
ncbi:P-loop NTPase fold protein [Chryseobacterium sp. Marseille-Q8038]